MEQDPEPYTHPPQPEGCKPLRIKHDRGTYAQLLSSQTQKTHFQLAHKVQSVFAQLLSILGALGFRMETHSQQRAASWVGTTAVKW